MYSRIGIKYMVFIKFVNNNDKLQYTQWRIFNKIITYNYIL